MKATIATSGTQLRVSKGDVIVVDRVDAKEGSQVKYSQVLLVEDKDKITVGNPHVGKATVEAKVLQHFRGKKVRIFKMSRRKKYRRTKGHRSELSRIEITDIKV